MTSPATPPPYTPWEYTPTGIKEAWVKQKLDQMQGRKPKPKKDRSN